MRLIFVVEGPTEEAFVNETFRPHLLERGVYASATIVGTPKRRGSAPLIKGGGDWSRWERDLRRVLGEQRGSDVRVTTMFDLYGLPEGFPGLSEHGTCLDTRKRCGLLENALSEFFDDWRLIPYLQRHEFEALVLASLDVLEDLLDAEDDLRGLADLRTEIGMQAPEDINDGKQTAPSKRIEACIPGYRKTLHGPLAAGGANLTILCDQCPRFSSWLGRLEALAEGEED